MSQLSAEQDFQQVDGLQRPADTSIETNKGLYYTIRNIPLNFKRFSAKYE